MRDATRREKHFNTHSNALSAFTAAAAVASTDIQLVENAAVNAENYLSNKGPQSGQAIEPGSGLSAFGISLFDGVLSSGPTMSVQPRSTPCQLPNESAFVIQFIKFIKKKKKTEQHI